MYKDDHINKKCVCSRRQNKCLRATQFLASWFSNANEVWAIITVASTQQLWRVEFVNQWKKTITLHQLKWAMLKNGQRQTCRMSLDLTKTWEIIVSGKSANPPPEPIVGVERKTWLKLLGMIHLVGTLIMLIICHLELVVVCTLSEHVNPCN